MSPCFNCRAWQRMSKPELSNLNAQMQHLKLWNFRRGGYMFLGAQKTKTSQPAVQQQHCFFVKLFCRASGNMLFRVNWLVVNGASLPVVFLMASKMLTYHRWTLITYWCEHCWHRILWMEKNVFTTMDYICASPRCPWVFTPASWATRCMCFCNAVSDCDRDPWHVTWDSWSNNHSHSW